MAWLRPNFDRLYRACYWIWRGVVFLWGYITGKFRPILGYATTALGWSKGNRVEPEIGPEETVTEPSHSDQQRAEELEGEDRNAAVIEKAAGYREPVPELPRPEEDDEEEFDSDEFRVRTSDEFYCNYDSTWETEETFETFKSPKKAAANRNVS